MLEKVVATQLDSHLHLHQLHDPNQSAYKAFHSTETALLKVQSDIADALDRGEIVLLLMLDMSAAFDTIDHSILLRRLEHSFGVTGDALSWIESYLKERVQSVVVGDSASDSLVLKYGVPQGSVLGPKLYCRYTNPWFNFQKT